MHVKLSERRQVTYNGRSGEQVEQMTVILTIILPHSP